MRRATCILSAAGWCVAAGFGQPSFVNWETPHVHPLEITPDGSKLLAVNTADNRLEVFEIGAGGLTHLGAVPVGLDPVSVRARTNSEAWVVNHISDSVSIVDLDTLNVKTTLSTLDEPADVVFAGAPLRAFVTCSQANTVQVFDPTNPGAAAINVAIDAEDPRALAVSPDGNTVYAAIFESGNGTTILGGGIVNLGPNAFPPNVVNDPLGPYGGTNPPPNDGNSFNPPINPALPPPLRVGLIVQKDAAGRWMDDNSGDWTDLVSGANAQRSGRPVGWDLPDRDIAIIDANSLKVTYATRLMNLCMALAVNPQTGLVTVVGTDATNRTRFEPNVRGQFTRVLAGIVDPPSPTMGVTVDLNAHLSYTTATVPQTQRDMSIGDPRGIVWNAAGTRAYVAGMGSNNVVIIDPAGVRVGLAPTIEVGEGPTGVALDESRNRLYVLNKFAASVSIVDLATETELSQTEFYDPSPTAIKVGRKHLYDTHKNSGLGQIACASCHVDTRMDRLAWDLGDPSGDMKSFNQNCNFGAGGLFGFPACQDWHPMKGPMMTQTFQDIIGKEPLHWRGDRAGLEEFAGAFISLQGDDTTPTAPEMQEFEDFLATVHFPPNPFRNLDNSLPTNLPLTGHFTTGRFNPAGQPLPNGNAELGLSRYRFGRLDGVDCVTCHTLPTGMGTNLRVVGPSIQPFPTGPNGELHHALVSVDGSTNVSIKIPQLRNLYEKVGFDATQSSNRAGYGLLHDGSIDSIARFVSEPVFSVSSDQDVANLVAFLLALSGSDLPVGTTNNPLRLRGPDSRDTHAAVGTQTTLIDEAGAPPAQLLLLADMVNLAESGAVGLVVKGLQADLQRGYAFVGVANGEFQSDRQAEQITLNALLAAAAPGSELTFTIVPVGSEIRIGIDRDEDAFFDRDELDVCSDPADPNIVPGGPGSGLPGDLNGDFIVDLIDLGILLADFGCMPPGPCPGDANGDGETNLIDLGIVLSNFGRTCP